MKSNREIELRIPNRFFGAKVDEISFMTLHQMGLFAAFGSPVQAVQLSATPEGGDRTTREPAYTASEARHQFAIETLDRQETAGAQPYLYTCVRCKWIFRINDSRGSIIALDGLGRHLAEPENSKRIVTFHRGPCPAFEVLEYLAHEVPRESRLDGYISKLVDAIRSLASRGRRSRGRAAQSAAS